jgi:hypothetical protein
VYAGEDGVKIESIPERVVSLKSKEPEMLNGKKRTCYVPEIHIKLKNTKFFSNSGK